ncbi:hypothetical protein CKY28_02025 [Sphingomonas lenta]|uniref:Bacterial dipeptidyl-peptidase SH3 domain-containing protein n=1 Tax=Sphingomonas lenta TaxID=1141887 RepID=A0A2A2SKV6_9SPHN|nr:hypothetical protein CKY28_02025 [Sphingomonas lenta]
MTGRSVKLHPRTHAVRSDLADVRLADQVFAPHYAAPLPRRVSRPVPLLAGRDGEPVAELAPGELFEVLEIAGDRAWGVAADRGLVGYVDAGALTA